MGADQHLDWRGHDQAAAAASLLDWWSAAGVDMVVEESPRDWLASAVAPIPAATQAVAGDAAPADWESYAAWRVAAQAPEHGWPGGWVAASGPTGAALMVLTDCPDRDDLAAGSLLAGDAGKLFDRMLAAIGLARADVHLASLCAKRPTAGRLPAEAEPRLAALARHHIALAAPRALLVLGDAASRAILATNVMAARGRLHFVNHGAADRDREIGVVASFHPRFLLEKPAAKAGAWADLRALKRMMGE